MENQKIKVISIECGNLKVIVPITSILCLYPNGTHYNIDMVNKAANGLQFIQNGISAKVFEDHFEIINK